MREALAALKPLLEDPSVLKIGQNIKYDLVVLSRYGIDVAPYDDTMLISYVLDAGTRRPRHGRAGRAAGSATSRSTFKDVAGSRQDLDQLRQVRSTRRPPMPPRTPT